MPLKMRLNQLLLDKRIRRFNTLIFLTCCSPDHDARRNCQAEKLAEVYKSVLRESFPSVFAHPWEARIQGQEDSIEPERQARRQCSPMEPQPKHVDEHIRHANMQAQCECGADHHREHHTLGLQKFHHRLQQGVTVKAGQEKQSVFARLFANVGRLAQQQQQVFHVQEDEGDGNACNVKHHQRSLKIHSQQMVMLGTCPIRLPA